MSRVTHLDVELPEEVETAMRVLGSRVRIEVLRELARAPRTTSELMRTLGVSNRATLLENLRDLEIAGAVTGSPQVAQRPGRAVTWRAQPARVAELSRALARHATGRRL